MLKSPQVRLLKHYCEELQQCRTNAEKEEAIRESFGNGFVYNDMCVLLNPLIMSGIKEKSRSKQVLCEFLTDEALQVMNCNTLGQLMKYLNSLPGITQPILAAVQSQISSLDEDLQAFASSFICKTLKVGVTGKTVNKTLGKKLIPVTECMLANKYFDHPKAIDGQKFFITEKFDGIRAISFINEDGSVRIISRQGQPITGLVEIEDDLRVMAREWGKGAFVLDGELLIDNRDNYPSKDQYKLTTQIVRKDGEKHGVTYHVFDWVDMDTYLNQGKSFSYASRRILLQEDLFYRSYDHIELVPVLYEGRDESAITRELNKQLALKHEGVMINIASAPYVFGRTNSLLKVKVMQDCDLRVTGVEEGAGKFAGTLGALIVDYKGNELRVGSGFTDEDRQSVWTNPASFIGSIVTVQYFEETQDKDGKLSLRFPVFLRFREDGKDVSYS